MQQSRMLIVLAAAAIVGLSVSLFAQGGGRAGNSSAVNGRYQISATEQSGSTPVAYVVDTQTGRVWRVNDTTRPYLIGDLPNRR